MICPEISGKYSFTTSKGCYYMETFNADKKCHEEYSFLAELWDENLNEIADEIRNSIQINDSDVFFLLGIRGNVRTNEVFWNVRNMKIDIDFSQTPINLKISKELVYKKKKIFFIVE